MTPLLLSLLVLIALYGLYFAARTARVGGPPGDFADGGANLPGWAVMFLLPGLAAAGLGVERHFAMVGRFGLQASHVSAGLVLVAIAALLVWNRLWMATRVAGLSTPGEALGRFYDSIALRVIVMGLTVLFALPFAGHILSTVTVLLEAATEGLIPRAAGVWLIAIALAIPAIVGGWRATIMTLAMYSGLLALLLPGLTILTEITATGPGFPAQPIGVADGILWDRIPGVLQNSAGIGKAMPPGGIFTAAAIASSSVALLGIVFSPAVLYLGQTAPAGRGFGVSTVWLLAGLVAGGFVLGGPVLAARMADGPVALAGTLFEIEPLAGAGLLLLMMIGGLLAVSFFVTGGSILITRELVLTYLFPKLDARQTRLGHRIALGFAFFFVALAASFAPLICAIGASVALPLSVQLLPALLGLTFLRVISRGAVMAGLAIGCLIVTFTEPLGLILFESLFVELPWGRWPLTIHSAAWGLAFNLAFVLLSSAATLRAPDRFQRDRLHDAVEAALPPRQTGGRGLLWSLMLLWGFLAYGPGAILGNTFFSEPIFTERSADLGIPSLWVWQILFWLLGVLLVWWFAYRVGLGRTSAERIKPITLGAPEDRRTPDWLAAGLERVAKKAS
ncbi:hypothetical protein [Roseovarius indicus]|uniref:hypothetical protein n=1 Tax=Roseovarius indicus TaxID=540747 RepID=UPI0007D9E24E|nr:hypothetical protein [Roseovarius indicus]OAO07439.1 hypothetical protein A8B76_09565 [Roseovarius indicus]